MKKGLLILLLVSMLIASLSSCELLNYIGIGRNDGAGKSHYLPGNIVVSKEEDGVKEITKTISIYYNEQNLPAQIIVVDADSDVANDVEYTINFTYDKNGNCIKEAYTDSDGETDTTQYTYDEMGKLIKATYVYDDDNRAEYTYTYDDKGNLIKEVGIDSYTEGYSHIWEHTYDENGNRIKYLYKHSNSEEAIYYYTYSYDENGNLSETVYYDDNGEDLSFSLALNYTYDEKGRLIREVQTRDSSTSSERYAYYTIDYTYDAKDALVKHVFTYYDGDKEIYEYNDYSLVYIDSVFSSEDFLKYLREIM